MNTNESETEVTMQAGIGMPGGNPAERELRPEKGAPIQVSPEVHISDATVSEMLRYKGCRKAAHKPFGVETKIHTS